MDKKYRIIQILLDCGWTNTGCGSFALAACRRAPSCSSATSSTHVLPVPHCTASTNSKSALGCLSPTHSRRTRASSWGRIVFSAQPCGRAEGASAPRPCRHGVDIKEAMKWRLVSSVLFSNDGGAPIQVTQGLRFVRRGAYCFHRRA